MRTSRLPNPLTAALVIGCTFLGWAVAQELLSHPFAPAGFPRSAGQSDDAIPAERRGWVMRPASDFATVLQRPLFIPGRRPPLEPGERTVDAKPPGKPAVLLSAVVSSPGRKLALIEGRAGVVLLSEGDEVDSWQLLEIHAEHVILRAGGARHRINLKDLPGESAVVEAGPAAVPESRAGSGAAMMLPYHQLPYHQPPLATGRPEIEPPADNADASGAGHGR